MPKTLVLKVLGSLLCLLLLPTPRVSAPQKADPAGQNQPSRQSPGQATDQDQASDQSVTTLKVNVDVVSLFFNVKDKKGALIPAMTKDDFNLFEDGRPQTIK